MNYNMYKVHSTLCPLLYAQCTTTVIRTVFTKTATKKRGLEKGQGNGPGWMRGIFNFLSGYFKNFPRVFVLML